jgi:predicted ATPase/class 3 adenylate cyclase
VTFLFTDIEGSTKRWEQDPTAMNLAVARHDVLLRTAIEAHQGYVFKTVGDAFCATFPTASAALDAALAAQRALDAEEWGPIGPIRVRMALHTGATEERDGDYFGQPVNRVARLLSAGHGGQTLLSQATQELICDHLPPGAVLRDLGAHRLKDLTRPEHIFQIDLPDLPHEFALLKTLSARPNNLPDQPTAFVGRDQEVQAVLAQLRRPAVRLLTLTGPGGTGKSRLSLAVAAELLEDYADGVFFVPLAPLVDGELVLPSIAQALAAPENPGQSIAKSLREYLHDKQLLLVIDNFEQVAVSAPVVCDLLASVPSIKMLVTSRIPLQCYGEFQYPVPPLALPDLVHLPPLATLAETAAVALFVARAQAVKPDFTLTETNAQAVATICAHLDGLPLALELAAARSRLLSPQAMLARLGNRLDLLSSGARDLPARQQTLRGAIDWSYDLLSPEEQRLFARLAVFVGGATLEAAETVCNADGDLAIDIFEGVESLVSKSLLRQEEQADGEPRISMLETIRQYGLEQLAHQGETTRQQQRYAAYYLELAETAALHLTGAAQVAWLERLETEHENIRHALRWSLNQQEAVQSLRLGGALFPFWLVRGHLTEGRQWLTEALQLASGPAEVVGHAAEAPPLATSRIAEEALLTARAHVLIGAGQMALRQGAYTEARGLYEESLVIARASGDRRGIATALHHLATVAERQGDYGTARTLFDESLAIRRSLADSAGIAASLHNLANVAFRQGDYERARSLYQESLTIRQQLGDKQGIAASINNLATIAVRVENYALARTLYEQSVALKRELGDRLGIALVLNNLADASYHQGDYAGARAQYEESLQIKQDLGDKHGIAYSLHGLGNVCFEQGDLIQASALYRESLRLTREQGDKWGIAQLLEALARLACARTQTEHALQWAAAAEAMREAIGASLTTQQQAQQAGWLAPLRQTLGPAAETLWAQGRARPLDQVIEESLNTQ